MAWNPGHGHEALRRGRWSMAGAEYFLTVCTCDRRPGLTEPAILPQVMELARCLEVESIWRLRTVVVMPDHMHLLISMGENTELTKAVRLFKGRLSPVLRKVELRWQPAYFDHRLRPDEDSLPVFLYIFLNPYRAKLLPQSGKWQGYFCCEEDWAWFGSLTNESAPFPEWLA